MQQDFERLLEQGVLLEQQGNMPGAEQCFRQALELFPRNTVALFLLSQVEGALKLAETNTPAIRALLAGFQNYQSHYYASLPYNLGWMIESIEPVEDFLRLNPIVLADIGARGGQLEELEGLAKHIAYYGFDADEAECARLVQNGNPGYYSFSMFPYFIGRHTGIEQFYEYANAGDSSLFLPNERFKEQFGGLNIVQAHTVASTTLDEALMREQAPFPDIIKLDTQGSELFILEGATKTLENASLVEVEVEFTEIYDGQPLFHDVSKYMNEHGFDLLYLNRVFQNREGYTGEARGQVIFGDALFGRRENMLTGLTEAQLAKYALLLINYGHIDIAKTIWDKHDGVRRVAPGLSEYMKPYTDDNERARMIANDKSLCWQLFKRRTNQIGSDSDRSWPVR